MLLIDDILESGKTLKFTRELMMERGAAQVSIAVLLDKSMRRKTDLQADFVGFECPDMFVVGYGMDVGHAFSQLPFVGVVRESHNGWGQLMSTILVVEDDLPRYASSRRGHSALTVMKS